MKLLRLPHIVRTWAKALILNIRYKLGAKFAQIRNIEPKERFVDCSGFFRWFLFHASGGEIEAPDGSWIQREWLQRKGMETRPYAYAVANRSGALFACFIDPQHGKAGHVWLVRNGRTLESRGGVGISSRPASTKYLVEHCDYCFRIA